MDQQKKKGYSKRLFVQVIFFGLILFIALSKSGYLPEIFGSACLHGLCPFGGVVSVYQYFSEGTLVHKIRESSFVLMYIVLFLTVLFGPVFCGWVCPLGSAQEWIGRIGAKIWKKKYNRFIPLEKDRYLRYLRYFVLVWVLYITAKTGVLMFEKVDPYYALFHFWTNEVAPTALVVLAVTILGALFVERPWCKYLCPFGALLGLGNFIRIFKIRRNASACVECRVCDRECPMNIEVSKTEIVYDHQCITCLKCTSEFAGPLKSIVSLSAKGPKKNLNISALILGSIVLLVFLGGIILSSLLGHWETGNNENRGKLRKNRQAEYHEKTLDIGTEQRAVELT